MNQPADYDVEKQDVSPYQPNKKIQLAALIFVIVCGFVLYFTMYLLYALIKLNKY